MGHHFELARGADGGQAGAGGDPLSDIAVHRVDRSSDGRLDGGGLVDLARGGGVYRADHLAGLDGLTDRKVERGQRAGHLGRVEVVGVHASFELGPHRRGTHEGGGLDRVGADVDHRLGSLGRAFRLRVVPGDLADQRLGDQICHEQADGEQDNRDDAVKNAWFGASFRGLFGVHLFFIFHTKLPPVIG